MSNSRGFRDLRELLAILAGSSVQPRDWRSLIDLAGETLTIGRLADALANPHTGLDVPADVLDLMLDIRERAGRRNDRLTAQFRALLTPLNAVGVRPIVMKGMARLAADPRERSRLLSDIDLLVPADRRDDCTDALARLGYSTVMGGADETITPVFARSCDVGTVDLHLRLKPPEAELRFNDVAQHCREVRYREGTALLPNSTMQLASPSFTTSSTTAIIGEGSSISGTWWIAAHW